MSVADSKLCIFCRCLEPAGQSCRTIQHISSMAATHKVQKDPQTVQVPLSNEDQKLIESLQQRPSSLCGRCSRYDVRRVFEQADYKDYIASRAISNALLAEYIDSQEKYKMYLG
jgi:hypothetical protein